MKTHKFAKFLMAILLLSGVFGLSACESAAHNAEIPTDSCSVSLQQDTSTGIKTAVVTLGIKNNTIYNTKTATIDYDVYGKGADGKEEMLVRVENDPVDIRIRHGLTGYLSYTVSLKDAEETIRNAATSVKITGARFTDYFSFWDTYVVPFVIMFVLAGVALVFAAIDIFSGRWNKEALKEALKEKLSLYLTIFAMTLLICLIPLMFSNWVVTLILVGGFVGVALLTGVMALIKMSMIEKK